MVTIHFWLFIILCTFALFGLVAFIFLIHMFVIDPIRDIIANYKKYENFYIENTKRGNKNGTNDL